MPNVRDLLHFRSSHSDKAGACKDDVCIPKNVKISDPMMMPEKEMIGSMPMATEAVTVSSGGAVPLTVVELFQSQGCSSCPPANDNVIGLADDPDKLVLTYEVTYWDYLGWPDTFGSKDWDVRQRDYSAAFKNRTVYTPQVIVNGFANGVGSRKGELAELLQNGKTTPYTGSVSVSVADGQVTVSGHAGMRAIVQLALYDPKNHDVRIRDGENRGRNLPHRNIVREMLVLGWWEGGQLKFPLPEMNKDGLLAAILVQKGRGGPIIGAAKV